MKAFNQEKAQPKDYEKEQAALKTKAVYEKQTPRVNVSNSSARSIRRATAVPNTVAGGVNTRRFSFNKSKTKTLLQEEIHFSTSPTSASFISYRDDSKFSTAFNALEEQDSSLAEIRAMIGDTIVIIKQYIQ